MKKHIVITGAGSGFGAEDAKIFNTGEYNLTLLDINVEGIKKLNIDGAFIEQLDVTNREKWKSVISQAVEKFGPVDLLINNAGIMKLGQIGVQPHEEFKQMIDINLMGTINGIEMVVNSMKERKTGTIINMVSTAGIKPYPNHAVYSATKYGVSGLTETLRMEMAPYNVRVVAICPGAFSTNLLAGTSSQKIIDDYETWKKSMSTMAKPYEVARMIKYVFESPQELNFREIQMHSTEQVE